jgi:hypothetical protein
MPPYCVAPWPNEEQAIEGATSRTYLPTESGRYRCLVTENDGQSYYTDYVYIYIHEPGLTISQEIQQLHINACSGDEVSLTFVVHDDKVDCQYRVNYAWQVNYGTEWESISGAN